MDEKGTAAKKQPFHIQNTMPSTSRSFAPCPHCQRTNHPPEKSWSGTNASIRPKRFKQDHPEDNQNKPRRPRNFDPFRTYINRQNLLHWKRCFNERIDGDMSNIVHTVAVRIQNGSLTFVDSSVAPKTDLAIRSINAFSGQTATSVAANSERGEDCSHF